MAKELEDLQESRKVRDKIIQKYGFVPKSVIDIKYGAKQVSEHDVNKQQTVQNEKLKQTTKIGDAFKYKNNAFEVSGKSIRGKSSGVSTFPIDLALFILNFYSEKNDLIVDPCAGHNSRMEITYKSGRSYIGYDVSKEYIRFNNQVRREIMSRNTLIKNENTIQLHAQSSEKMTEGNNIADLCYTSPPYWDLEFYGDEKEQLGYKKTYDQFLEGLGRIISECYRILKQDKFCVFNVNDFRKKGKFYSYHSDVIRLFEQSGFSIWDIVIVKWRNCMGQVFASQVENNKITAKTHEYLIVGKK